MCAIGITESYFIEYLFYLVKRKVGISIWKINYVADMEIKWSI